MHKDLAIKRLANNAADRIIRVAGDIYATHYLSTGFQSFDMVLGGGFTQGGLHLLTGPSRVGKSTVLQTCLFRLSIINNIPVGMICKEPDLAYMFERYLRELTGIAVMNRSPNLESLNFALKKVIGSPITIIQLESYDTISNPAEVKENDAFHYCPAGGHPIFDIRANKLVMIDGLTVRDSKIIDKIRRIRNTAREYNIPIIVGLELPPFFQFDEQISLQALDEVCSIVHLADTVISVHRGLTNIESSNALELHLKKHAYADEGMVALYRCPKSALLKQYEEVAKNDV